MIADRIDAADVRAALTGAAIVARFGLEGRRSGTWHRTRTCPTCGPRSRPDAVAINLETGGWQCHAHGCSGDALALVAAAAGLDVRRDFGAVLGIAAEIAGVTPATGRDDRQRAAARAHLEARRAAAEAADRDRQAEAGRRAAARWGELPTRCPRGEGYLASRGLDPAALTAAGVVRFAAAGPAVALHDAAGAVVNVITRAIDPGDGPKVRSMTGATITGTMIGAVPAIRRRSDGARPVVVVTEGMTDALAATLAWPRAVVLGASGADAYRRVIAMASAAISASGARALLCIDDDESGRRAGVAAVETARAGGVVDALEVVDLAHHHDLAAAYSAGWRP